MLTIPCLPLFQGVCAADSDGPAGAAGSLCQQHHGVSADNAGQSALPYLLPDERSGSPWRPSWPHSDWLDSAVHVSQPWQHHCHQWKWRGAGGSWRIAKKNKRYIVLQLFSLSRAWCKTMVTTSFYIRSYNSFAPSPRYALLSFLEKYQWYEQCDPLVKQLIKKTTCITVMFCLNAKQTTFPCREPHRNETVQWNISLLMNNQNIIYFTHSVLCKYASDNKTV